MCTRAAHGPSACLIAPRLQGGSATAGVEPAWRLVSQAPPCYRHGGLPAATAAILTARRGLDSCLAVRGAGSRLRLPAHGTAARRRDAAVHRGKLQGCGVAERRCRCGRGRAARAALRAAVRGEAGCPAARGAGAVRMTYSPPIGQQVGDGGSRTRVALGVASAAVLSARWATDCPTSPFFMKRAASYTFAFSIIRYNPHRRMRRRGRGATQARPARRCSEKRQRPSDGTAEVHAQLGGCGAPLPLRPRPRRARSLAGGGPGRGGLPRCARVHIQVSGVAATAGAAPLRRAEEAE